MENPNVAIKERFVAAVFAGDTDTLRALIHPEFALHQPPGLAYEGIYRGVDGFLAFLAKFNEAYDLEALEPTGIYVRQDDPDALALGFHISGTLRSSGRRFESPQYETWTFRDGKVIDIRVFWFRIPD